MSASASQTTDCGPQSTHDRLSALAEYLNDLPGGARMAISMANCPVELRFGDDALMPLLGTAFEHLRMQECVPPSLRITCHTFASAPQARQYLLPLSSAAPNDILVRDEEDWTVIVQRQGDITSVIDWKRMRAYWIASGVQDVPFIERAAPIKNLISRWIVERGVVLTHGAAVGVGTDGVLIVGHGGSGKSTTSILSMLAGLGFASDDHCLISLVPDVRVHSMYCTAKLKVDDVEQFPALAGIPTLENRPPDEKVVYLLKDRPGIRIESGFRMRALFLARITGRPSTELKRIPQAEAFRALTGSCALHLPRQRAKSLRHFSELSRIVPCYVLELGTDFRQIPQVIQRYLSMNV